LKFLRKNSASQKSLIFYAVFDLWQLNTAKKREPKKETKHKQNQKDNKIKDNNIQRATKSNYYKKLKENAEFKRKN
jgi:hypothetical protein